MDESDPFAFGRYTSIPRVEKWTVVSVSSHSTPGYSLDAFHLCVAVYFDLAISSSAGLTATFKVLQGHHHSMNSHDAQDLRPGNSLLLSRAPGVMRVITSPSPVHRENFGAMTSSLEYIYLASLVEDTPRILSFHIIMGPCTCLLE